MFKLFVLLHLVLTCPCFANDAAVEKFTPPELWGGGVGESIRLGIQEGVPPFEAKIFLGTLTKRVQVSWKLLDSVVSRQEYEVSFEPTAVAQSIVDHGTFYLAGMGAAGAVVEKWQLMVLLYGTLLDPELIFPPAVCQTLPVPNALGPISDITVNAWIKSAPGTEELWILEYGTAEVFRLSAEGSLIGKVSSCLTDNARSILVLPHSDLGVTCLLRGRPWFKHVGPFSELSYRVLFDRGYDGQFEGNLWIDYKDWKTHPIVVGGEFFDLDR